LWCQNKKHNRYRGAFYTELRCQNKKHNRYRGAFYRVAVPKQEA
jgi:hypothetical protein